MANTLAQRFSNIPFPVKAILALPSSMGIGYLLLAVGGIPALYVGITFGAAIAVSMLVLQCRSSWKKRQQTMRKKAALSAMNEIVVLHIFNILKHFNSSLAAPSMPSLEILEQKAPFILEIQTQYAEAFTRLRTALSPCVTFTLPPLLERMLSPLKPILPLLFTVVPTAESEALTADDMVPLTLSEIYTQASAEYQKHQKTPEKHFLLDSTLINKMHRFNESYDHLKKFTWNLVCKYETPIRLVYFPSPPASRAHEDTSPRTSALTKSRPALSTNTGLDPTAIDMETAAGSSSSSSSFRANSSRSSRTPG